MSAFWGFGVFARIDRDKISLREYAPSSESRSIQAPDREENSNGSIANVFPNIFRTNCPTQFVPCFPHESGPPLAWPKTALIDMMAWYADHLAFIEPNGIQEVSGSIPLISTNLESLKSKDFGLSFLLPGPLPAYAAVPQRFADDKTRSI